MDDLELTKNTNFTLLRQDRAATSHPKKGGGGVALLLRSELKFKQHLFENIVLLQYICVTVLIESSRIVLVNIYSPFGFVAKSNQEIAILLREVEKLDKTDLVILEDFNMPNIHWSPDEEFPGVYLPFGNESTEIFTNMFFDHNLLQIIGPPADRNHLDLAFVTDINSCHYTYPISEELLDRTSVRHSPFIINYQIITPISDKITYQNFGRINLRKTKRELLETTFSYVSEDDTFIEQWSDNTIATSKVVDNINKIRDNVLRNTPDTRTSRSWISKHPWLKNSKSYNDANLFKIESKKKYLQLPTELNRDIYRRASFTCSEIYEREKSQFLIKTLDDTRGNTYEFYSLMKGGSKIRKETPDSMLSNGIYVKDNEKLVAF